MADNEYTGIYLKTDEDKRSDLDILKDEAKAGNVNALNTLGMKYYNGDGVEQSFENAADCFYVAASKKDTQAQLMMGKMYLNGDISKDDELARQFLTDAANSGSEEAGQLLAEMNANDEALKAQQEAQAAAKRAQEEAARRAAAQAKQQALEAARQQAVKAQQEKEDLLASLKRGRNAVQSIVKYNTDIDSLEKNKPKQSFLWKFFRLAARVIFIFCIFSFLYMFWWIIYRRTGGYRIGRSSMESIYMYGAGVIIFYFITRRFKRTAKTAKAYSEQIQGLKDQVSGIKKEFAKELSLLPEPYDLDISAYTKAIQYVTDGSAGNIDDIVRMLRSGL